MRLTRRQFTATASVAAGVAAFGLSQARPALADHDGAFGEGGLDPAVAIHPETGAVYVVWFQPADEHKEEESTEATSEDHGHMEPSSGAILIARSDDGGATFAAPVAASGEDADVTSLSQCSPLIAFGPAGELYVLYARHQAHAGVDFGLYTLRLARSDDGGATFAPAVEVFSDAAENGSYQDILVGPAGEIYVSWFSYRQYMPENTIATRDVEVRIARSDDGGASFGASVQIDPLSCECCRTSLAMAADGALLIAWRNQEPQAEGDSIRNHVISRSTDGGATWDEPTLIHDDNWIFGQCPESGPMIKFDAAGELTAVWFTGVETGPGVYTARSADLGASFDAPVALVTDDYFPHSNVGLAIDDAGAAFITFDDVREEAGTVRVVKVTPGAEPETLLETTGGWPAIATHGGNTVVTWVDAGTVRVQSLAAGG